MNIVNFISIYLLGSLILIFLLNLSFSQLSHKISKVKENKHNSQC